MLYNVPGRTVASLAPETTIRLRRIPNIVAIKEASGDLEAITKIVAETPEDFSVYSGDDSLTLPVLSVGARGIVSVASISCGTGNAANDQTLYRVGNTAHAALIHQKLLPMMKGFLQHRIRAPSKQLFS